VKVLRIYHSGVVSGWRSRDRKLRDLGADLTLISSQSWNEGGRVVSLTPDPDEVWVVGARTWGRHPFRFVYDPRPLWRALREGPVDVLDIHEEPASLAVAEVLLLVALARKSQPAVCLYSAQNIYKRYPLPFRWLERLALRRASAIHTCNEAAGDIMRRKGFTGVVRNLGLGVDVERFRPEGCGADADPGVMRMGYVGRLEHHKGVDVLLRALAKVPAADLTVVGEGPAGAELARLVEQLGLRDRVSMQGFATYDDLPDVYRRFEVVVVPSLETASWIEQFGRVAVEAMASGSVVVASDSGSLPEVIGEAGILVPPGDESALADALQVLRDDAGLRAGLAEAGPGRAAFFSWTAVAARHEALYEEMVR